MFAVEFHFGQYQSCINILEIINVNFEVTDQLLNIYSIFVELLT